MENDFPSSSSPLIQALKYAPLVAVLLIALWSGYRGYWYWGKNVRAVLRQVEADRDGWREIALMLLRNSGIEIPASVSPASVAELLLSRDHENGGGLP